jgi:hypothetical protein
MATISAIHNGFYVVKTYYQNPLNLLMAWSVSRSLAALDGRVGSMTTKGQSKW